MLPLYAFIKVVVRIFYPTYYDIGRTKMENIPAGTPIVLACNHTNAFVDPILPAMAMKQRVRFFARGDVFKGAFLKWLLNQINMSPVYRAQDGYTDRSKNDATFKECRERLHNNETLLIYPEGICQQEKRLLPLKKGLARILFSVDDHSHLQTDALVIPVGINYSNAKKFRSKVLLKIGDPISTKEYKKGYGENDSKLFNDFTNTLENKMRDLIITIDHKENDELVEDITEIYLEQLMQENGFEKSDIKGHFTIRDKIAKIINYQMSNSPEAISDLKSNTSDYISQLHKYELRDHLLRPESINNSNTLNFILEFFTLWLGLPIYGLALLLNYPPYLLGKKLSSNIKNNEFKASIYLNVAMFAWMFYYGIQIITIGLLFHNWALLGIYGIFVPLLGYFSLRYYPIMKKIMGRWRLLRLARTERGVVENILRLRTDIIQHLDIAKKSFDATN